LPDLEGSCISFLPEATACWELYPGFAVLLEVAKAASDPDPGLPETAPVEISVLLLAPEATGEEVPPLHLVDIVLGFSLLPYEVLFLSLLE
jgi:hypothetical protein